MFFRPAPVGSCLSLLRSAPPSRCAHLTPPNTLPYSLYYKDISPHEVSIVSPMSLGGLKSTEYLAKNPQGLMPLFVLSEGDEPIPESDTIARFLCNTFATRGPELAPASPVAAARVDKICRHHDLYIAPIQGALYKATGPNMFPPFGRFATRSAAIGELIKQVKALEGMVAPYGGPYLCGSSPTGADCALFPTCCFLMKMLPKFDVDTNDAFGPTLSKWWEHMSTNDPVGVRVYGEIIGALDGWDEKGRWDTIAGAGLRDTASSTLFDKILAKELPADVVYEDEHVRMSYQLDCIAPTAPFLQRVATSNRRSLPYSDPFCTPWRPSLL